MAGGKTYTLGELARLVRGELVGDADTVIRGVGVIRDARPGDITFLSDRRYQEFLATTRASAVLVPEGYECPVAAIRVDNPHRRFVDVLAAFAPTRESGSGVHETAIVHETAEVAEGAFVGPQCHVGAGARIGEHSILVCSVYLGESATVGAHCTIYPHVTIREKCQIGNRVVLQPGVVIGSDGFGFVMEENNLKIPHLGNVVVEDDVEIGANSTVDRSTAGTTRIGRGSKLDNLVQVAHNCTIGEYSLLAGQSGLSGSVELGKRVVLAGQAGVVGHVVIGDGVIIAAQSGVSKPVVPGTTVSGSPAMEHSRQRRLFAYYRRLEKIHQKIEELSERVKRLEEGEDR